MLFPHAQYVYDSNTKTFKIVETDPTLLIPWIPVDPAQPDLEKYPRFAHARPMTVILKPGDILYLPTGSFLLPLLHIL